jgi:hypothetical protein
VGWWSRYKRNPHPPPRDHSTTPPHPQIRGSAPSSLRPRLAWNTPSLCTVDAPKRRLILPRTHEPATRRAGDLRVGAGQNVRRGRMTLNIELSPIPKRSSPSAPPQRGRTRPRTRDAVKQKVESDNVTGPGSRVAATTNWSRASTNGSRPPAPSAARRRQPRCHLLEERD